MPDEERLNKRMLSWHFVLTEDADNLVSLVQKDTIGFVSPLMNSQNDI
jgi:hypothetical protein